MPLTPVLTKRFGTDQPWKIDNYEALDGYAALRKALTHGARRAHRGGQGLQPARPRRRRLPDRHEVAVHPAGQARRAGQAALRRGQRRRGRAGHLPRPAADDERPALDDRGHHHRLLRGARASTRSSTSAARPCTRSAGCTAAVREAYERRATSGANILGCGFDCEITVHGGAGAYICGEETALLDSLEGKRGQPRLKPPFPATNGLYDAPTVVNNVGTLASVPYIVLGGADWFKQHGSGGLARPVHLLAVRTDRRTRASTRRRWAPRCASCSRWPAA